MKRTRIRERAIRIAAGSLISSDLSLAELSEIGRSLREDPSLTSELGHLLEETAHTLRSSRSATKRGQGKARTDPEALSLVEQILSVFKRRRSAKKTVIARLQGLDGKEVGLLDHAWTLREIVETFVTRARPDTVGQLLCDLGLVPHKPTASGRGPE